MNRRLRLMAAACVALGGAYVMSNWWLGQQIEQEHQRQLERVLAVVGPDKLVSNTYERGLFSSTATLVLQLKVPAAPSSPVPGKGRRRPMSWADESPQDSAEGLAQDTTDLSAEDADMDETMEVASSAGTASSQPYRTLRVHLVQDVDHGPLTVGGLAAAAVETRLLRVDGLEPKVHQLFADLEPPVLNTVHGFGQAVEGQFTLPAGEIKDPTGPSGKSRLEWDALRYDFDIDSDRSRIRGEGQWPLLAGAFSQPGNPAQLTLTMEGLAFQSEHQLNASQWLMPAGQHEGSLSRFEIKLDDKHTPLHVLLSDVRAESQTQQTEGVLNMKQQISGKAEFGPLSFEKLNMESEIQRVDARVLAELQQLLIAAIKTASTSDDAPKAPDFEQLFNRLLAASPELKERISLTTDGETAFIAYGFKVDPSITPSADDLPPALANAERLKGSASITLPRTFVKTIAKLLDHPQMSADQALALMDTVAAQGYLKRTDTGWTTEAEFTKGSLTINGKPVFDNYGMGLLGRGAIPDDSSDDETQEEDALGVE